MVKVRACLKCKHFVVIKEGFKNQQAIKLFEREHTGHNLATIDYNEVKDKASGYESHTNAFQDRVV